MQSKDYTAINRILKNNYRLWLFFNQLNIFNSGYLILLPLNEKNTI
jgi:hypothetical protein